VCVASVRDFKVTNKDTQSRCMHPKLSVLKPNKQIKNRCLFASNTFFPFQNMGINTARFRAVENNVRVKDIDNVCYVLNFNSVSADFLLNWKLVTSRAFMHVCVVFIFLITGSRTI
jgi:hypothetical protein